MSSIQISYSQVSNRRGVGISGGGGGGRERWNGCKVFQNLINKEVGINGRGLGNS